MKYILIASVLFCGSQIAVAQLDKETAVIVELKAESMAIAGSRVRVKDIADVVTFVSDGRSEKVTSMRARLASLARFEPGKNRLSFRHKDIRNALAKSGFSPANVEIKGPSEIRVRRKTIRLGNRRILDMVTRHVRNALVGIDDAPVISFSRHVRPVEVPLARWSSELRIEDDPKNTEHIGAVNLRLTAELDGIIETLALIPVLITRKVLAVRMVRSLKKGKLVTRNDVKMEKQEVSRMGGQLFFRISDVVGLVARRDLAKGDDVMRTDIKQTPVIRKDDLIEVSVKAGLITARTVCLALQDGSPGEAILVQNLESKGQFTAVVVDSKNAEVKSIK
ncbi:MAG: flagella basal body P-ring formation protein FlgA [Planctomycetota bacterium]|jgi:flagella basal body P-ring formation protein FlgA